MKPLQRAFFARPAPEVARDLVGMLLVCADEGLVARLAEVEAYMQDDEACHAYGRRTPRLEPLYGPAGHAYVYFTYGMHWCPNISTGVEGTAEGCLLRAAEPLAGLELMRARRGSVPDRDLLRGPARLAQAFGLDGNDSGRDLCDGGPLHLADDGCRPEVEVGPRVGVSVAAERPWRFVAAGSPWVSPYKRHREAIARYESAPVLDRGFKSFNSDASEPGWAERMPEMDDDELLKGFGEDAFER